MEFVVESLGDVAILRPTTQKALSWLDRTMRGAMRYGDSVVLERYQVPSTLAVLQQEGFAVVVRGAIPEAHGATDHRRAGMV